MSSFLTRGAKAILSCPQVPHYPHCLLFLQSSLTACPLPHGLHSPLTDLGQGRGFVVFMLFSQQQAYNLANIRLYVNDLRNQTKSSIS